MTTIQQMHPRYRLGFQSDAATAANAALFAGLETLERSRSMLADVKRVFGTRKGNLRPQTATTSEEERTAVRGAHMVRDAAEQMFGLVSTSACGLWGLTSENRIFVVESTDHGNDYLRGVRFVAVAHLRPGGEFEPDLERHEQEFPVEQVVAFLDSYADAHAFREGDRVG